MKVFSYKDYIRAIHALRLNAVLKLAEEEMNYKINKEETKDKKISLIKEILKDKKQMCIFINEILRVKEKVDENDLIRCSNKFIKKKNKEEGVDLLYRLRDKDIYFLIKLQEVVDNSMSYKMLNYCIDIMQKWCKNKNLKNINRNPVIIPIVIYTGEQKWQISTNMMDNHIGMTVFENYKIKMEYNLIEITKIPNNFWGNLESRYGDIMI